MKYIYLVWRKQSLNSEFSLHTDYKEQQRGYFDLYVPQHVQPFFIFTSEQLKQNYIYKKMFKLFNDVYK